MERGSLKDISMSKTIREVVGSIYNSTRAELEANKIPFDDTLMLSVAEMLDKELPKSLSTRSKYLIASALGTSSAGYYDMGKKYGEKI